MVVFPNIKRSLPLLFGVLALVCLSVSCSDGEKGYYTLDGFALGTTYHIVAQLPDSTGLHRRLEGLLERASASMSVYDPGSLLNRLNRNETDSLDHYIADCIGIASRVSRLSGGVYDITVKPVTQAWGFTGAEAHGRPNLDSLLQYVGYEKIRVVDGRLVKDDPAIQIELNSVAKGYIVDLVGEMLAAMGSENYLVEIGGEVVCLGVNPRGKLWTVGIDAPTDGNFFPGSNIHNTLQFTGMGLATSGNYRKYYIDERGNKVVHTINALTGESTPSNLLSATVIAPTSALADALGTMFMAVGLEGSIEYLESTDEALGYLIYDDGQGGYAAWYSPGLEEMKGH